MTTGEINKPNNAVRIIDNEIHRYDAYLNNFEHELDEKVYFGIRMKIEALQEVRMIVVKMNTVEFEED